MTTWAATGCHDCDSLTSGRCWRHASSVIVGAYGTGTPRTRVCPTCNGTGINPVATYMLCPKCNGEKAVPYA